jgi:F-type H+-transporting ATPase subunit b
LAFAASGGGEHGEVKAKGWVATDTYRVLNFAVLAGALVFLLRKPLSQALGSRIKGIQAQLEDLEAKKAEAEKILSEYNAKISRLSQESEGIVSEYIRQGNEAKARILKEAEASAYKLEEQARRNIENEFELAKQRLQQDIFEKAMVKAEEIIKKNITADDQNRLVDEYLDKVVA